MNDAWKDRTGRRWFGYWQIRLDGTWGYLMHPEGADTDMCDMEIDEVHEYFGPITNAAYPPPVTRPEPAN